ncbi:hypothetical protein EAF00_005255 [Botryotinia globosa]|nr:hypothetical protein EAF00_005255 [Botryotinia globosa]
MRFSVVAASMFAGAAMAATSTDYVTEEVTITSCAATVTDCPARSTQVSTTIYSRTSSTEAAHSSVTPAGQPSKSGPIASGPVSSAPAPSPSADACAATCAAEYDTCRGAPDANRSTCASNYSSCLGYSPYDSNGSLVTPTACSSVASATSAPASSAPKPSAPADACAATCATEYNTCRSAPDANRSTCASNYSSCLGYSPYDNNGSLVTPTACSKTIGASTTPSSPSSSTTADACASQCNASYNTCRSAPDANRSTCASNYASCLGYSPYDSNGSLITPTTCSKTVGASTTPSSPSSSTTADACASQCNASYNTCRSAPDANRSTCASNYASCLGYSPYDSNGSLVTPTACSAPSAPASSKPASFTPTYATPAASSAGSSLGVVASSPAPSVSVVAITTCIPTVIYSTISLSGHETTAPGVPAASAKPSSTGHISAPGNGTTPPVATQTPLTFTGAAANLQVGGAAIAAVFGLAAFLL